MCTGKQVQWRACRGKLCVREILGTGVQKSGVRGEGREVDAQFLSALAISVAEELDMELLDLLIL